MTISDLFRYSWKSLIRRKLRTILTILGVVIGIASIVVMVSLGLGLREQSMAMIEQYGGLTTITVREGNGNSSGGASDQSKKSDPTDGKLSDETVENIKKLDHVEIVSPVLTFQCVMRSGAYESSCYNGYGYSLEALKSMKWKFNEGDFPKEGDPLKFIYGNMYLQEFSNYATGQGYWETNVLPDIDLMKDPIFTVFDTEAYNSLKGNSNGYSEDDGSVASKPAAPPKKYLIPTAGVLYGNTNDDYRDYSWSVYCDIEALEKVLKKEYRNKAIPDQPVKKNGSPYRQLFYNQIYVRSDSVDHVLDLQKEIGDMGYSVESNYEWIEETQKQARSQQAMLGGIGCVSLLVAAIGIANTMMMSIYERTKEIGVMKVLGCNLSDIRGMFLLEATMIGALGGIIGDLISFIASLIINAVTAEKTSVTPIWLMLMGFVFAVLVGMAAGYFPSKRAMELSPLAAIRNE